MNLKFMGRVSEREPAIPQFVIVKNKSMSVFNASVWKAPLGKVNKVYICMYVIDHEFHHNIVKVVRRSTRSTATLAMRLCNKSMSSRILTK